MTSTRRTFIASLAGAGIVSTAAVVYRVTAQGDGHGKQQGWSTPEAATCQIPMMGMATPGVVMGTPMASVDFDLMYIDMMIPHHESIIALAEVAMDELQDARLVAIAEAILETQPGEIDELKALRQEWYGDPEPAKMTPGMMSMVMGMEHTSCSDAGHMDQMKADWQVEKFTESEDKDLAFIDQVIPHHEMAVQSSQHALQYAQHQEIRDISQRVIDAQQVEIDELQAIREELTGTPAA